MLEGGGFNVLLVAAGYLAGVAVSVEILHILGDGGIGGLDNCVILRIGLVDVLR